MLTDFQKKKLTKVFALYDADHDGYIGKEDYERTARNLVTEYGFREGSPEYQKVYASYLGAWEGTRRMADRDNDNRISLEEHLAGYDHMLATAGTAAFQAISNNMLSLADIDGDGKWSESEYVRSLLAFGGGTIDTARASAAFKKLDGDGDGYIDQTEMVSITHDFFASNDPQARGNWLMGAID